MKKLLFLLGIIIVFVSCGNYVKETQHGVVVDVVYVPDNTRMVMRPVFYGDGQIHYRLRREGEPEHWHAHVHYNDTICVYEDFYYKVQQGDSVTRIVRVKIEDEEKN